MRSARSVALRAYSRLAFSAASVVGCPGIDRATGAGFAAARLVRGGPWGSGLGVSASDWPAAPSAGVRFVAGRGLNRRRRSAPLRARRLFDPLWPVLSAFVVRRTPGPRSRLYLVLRSVASASSAGVFCPAPPVPDLLAFWPPPLPPPDRSPSSRPWESDSRWLVLGD